MRDVIDSLEANPIRGRWNQAKLERAADAVGAAVVQPPAPGLQISAAYGILPRLEVGLRTSVNALRGWARWQFLKVRPGVYGSVGVGVTGYLYGFPVQNFTSRVEVHEYQRIDYDMPLLFGYSGRYLHVWGGPKVVLSTFDAGFRACTHRVDGTCREQSEVSLDGTAAYLGGQLGFAVGYRRFWVGFELTIVRLGTEADLALSSGDEVAEARFEHSGMVLQPAIGVISWF
ncbi:MAG: hypothetical protein AAGF12_18200 [Myxococcota bacterium]